MTAAEHTEIRAARDKAVRLELALKAEQETSARLVSEVHTLKTKLGRTQNMLDATRVRLQQARSQLSYIKRNEGAPA